MESGFLQETRLGRRCLYVLMEILNVRYLLGYASLTFVVAAYHLGHQFPC